jgi:hypothetical protein
MRQMIWIKTEGMEAWGCSRCAWIFNPSDPPRGSSLDEMKQNYERQREKEYASHVCGKHSRSRSIRVDSIRESNVRQDPRSGRDELRHKR